MPTQTIPHVTVRPTVNGITVSVSSPNVSVTTSPQGPPGPGVNWDGDSFSPTAGQVTFILTREPTDSESVVFEVNGLDYVLGDHFTRSGLNITWNDTAFVMETTDRVRIKYA